MNSLVHSADLRDLIWVQTGFIGDIVLTTAAIELAAKEFPHIRQHVVTTQVGVQVLKGAFTLASVTPFAKGSGSAFSAFKAVKEALAKSISQPGKAVLLQAHRSFRSSFLCRYLGITTITYAETSGAILASVRVPRVAPLHEAQRIALLLEPLGLGREKILAARPNLPPLHDAAWQDGRASVSGALGSMPRETCSDGKSQANLRALADGQGPIVAFAPGSVWGTKRWLPESFEGLGRKLLADESILLVLLGSGTERELCQRIERGMTANDPKLAGRVVNLAGMTTLEDLRRIYPKLSLLVTNDSSPVHFASAFDVPTVAIFGATIPEMGFGPLASRSKALGIKLNCRPCSDHGPQVCPLGHFRCMRELGVEEVYRSCVELLGKVP